MTAEGDAVVLVRTSKVWWLLLLAVVGLLLFVMVAPLSAVDRVFVSPGVVALFGFCWAGLTARIEGRGSTLAVVGMFRVVLLRADGIERIDEGNGPVVVSRDGRRWAPVVFHMFAEHPWAAATTRRRAAAIRSWLANQVPQDPLEDVPVQQHFRVPIVRWTLGGACLAFIVAGAISALR